MINQFLYLLIFVISFSFLHGFYFSSNNGLIIAQSKNEIVKIKAKGKRDAEQIASSKFPYTYSNEQKSKDNMLSVAKLCRSTPVDVPYEHFLHCVNKKMDVCPCAIARIDVQADNSTDKMIAYVLPNNLKWFSFVDSKQRNSPASNLFMVKDTTPADSKLRSDTLDALRKQKSIIWKGHSGIGKSIEVNAIMMTLIHNLGKEGWPKKVAHRIQGKILLYELEEGEIKCHTYSGKTLIEVETFCSDIVENRKELVLVLELKESEQDPCLSGVTTFIALSSREVSKQVKTLLKDGNIEGMLREPHTEEEALMVCSFMYLLDREATLARAALDESMSLKEFQEAMKERIHSIGPLMREILNGYTFKTFKDERDLTSPQDFLKNGLTKLSSDNIPAEAKYFVAPYRPTDPSFARSAEFRFLCDEAAAYVREAVTSSEQVKAMRAWGLDYQITEALLLDALSPNHVVDWSRWERCVDPGYETELLRKHIVPGPFTFPKYKHLINFNNKYLKKDVSTMSHGELYRSTVVNSPVGEFFLFENVDGRRKITFYQTTSKPLPNHPFSVSAILAWHKALGLDKTENSDVEVVIEAVVDYSNKNTKGMKFVPGSEVSSVQEMTITKLRKQYPSLKNWSSSIVRASVYPNAADLPKVELIDK